MFIYHVCIFTTEEVHERDREGKNKQEDPDDKTVLRDRS